MTRSQRLALRSDAWELPVALQVLLLQSALRRWRLPVLMRFDHLESFRHSVHSPVLPLFPQSRLFWPQLVWETRFTWASLHDLPLRWPPVSATFQFTMNVESYQLELLPRWDACASVFFSKLTTAFVILFPEELRQVWHLSIWMIRLVAPWDLMCLCDGPPPLCGAIQWCSKRLRRCI